LVTYYLIGAGSSSPESSKYKEEIGILGITIVSFLVIFFPIDFLLSLIFFSSSAIASSSSMLNYSRWDLLNSARIYCLITFLVISSSMKLSIFGGAIVGFAFIL